MDPLISGVLNLKQAHTMSQVQMAVARKVLDSQQLQGAAAVKLIEAACNGTNQASNQLAAAATGLGAQLDVTA